MRKEEEREREVEVAAHEMSEDLPLGSVKRTDRMAAREEQERHVLSQSCDKERLVGQCATRITLTEHEQEERRE